MCSEGSSKAVQRPPLLYTATDNLPKTIPAPSLVGPGVVSSTIVVPDNFVIQGDTTSSRSQRAAGHRSTSRIRTTRISRRRCTTTWAQPSQVAVPLFSGVGNWSSRRRISPIPSSTTTRPLQFRAVTARSSPRLTRRCRSPASRVWMPRGPGRWSSERDLRAVGGVGTLNGWSLSFQKPLPTTGLGRAGQRQRQHSFSIFTLGQTDGLSSEQWTAVGPAAITGACGPGECDRGRSLGRVGQHGLRRRRQRWDLEDDQLPDDEPQWSDIYSAHRLRAELPESISAASRSSRGTTIPISRSSSRALEALPVAKVTRRTPGVGFLMSTNGGTTWNLYDSTNNFDSKGNFLPINSTSRDRKFVGMTVKQGRCRSQADSDRPGDHLCCD